MAAEPLPLVARAVVIAVAMLGVFGLLLARFEGITPRSVARAMRGQG
jgi:VIT1/CCC1 family predicted Fe2+/Mn2+ transporter